MESDDGFEAFGRAIESDPIGVLLAKWRQDAFIEKLKKLPGVVKVIPSGSLARDTHIGPVHDIDLIAVFDPSRLPGYGGGPDSARVALEHAQKGLIEQLHPLTEEEGLLRDTKLGDHTVKCFTDVPRPFAEAIPSAPPVDVMPAVREGFHLKIPEQGTGWIRTDPEKFMREVAQRQHQWKYFTKVIGMMKAWAKHNNLHISNLAIEVMVIKWCPKPRLFETLSCGEAVARFFETARARVDKWLVLPGWLSAIDKSISLMKLQGALDNAAKLSREAMKAESAWERGLHNAVHPDAFWRKLFGSKYPHPQRRLMRISITEWWFGESNVESPTAAEFGDLGATRPHSGRKHPDNGSPNDPGGHGSEGPDSGPGGPRPGPGGLRPHGGSWGGPGASPDDGKAGRRVRRTALAPAEAGASFWTGIFTATGAGAASVPLTFG
jgi:hypothetical protein